MKHDWVLVYVRPDCRPCDAVFAELGDGSVARPPAPAEAAGEREMRRERAAQAAAAARGEAKNPPKASAMRAERPTYFSNVEDAPQKLIIVVGGATVEELKQMAAEMPWIPQGSWYADPAREAAAKLKWQSAPVVAGISGGSVKWSYVGIPPQGLPLRSLMSDWHEGHAEPRLAGPARPRQ
jgi:hypothetical protein